MTGASSQSALKFIKRGANASWTIAKGRPCLHGGEENSFMLSFYFS